MNSFAECLKELRVGKGVTQVKLADDIGVSKGTVAMWETGKREPDFDTLITLSHYFGATTDDILGRRGLKAAAGKQTVTNFDVWKQKLTPEFIAEGKFLALSCGSCPARDQTCMKYDTTCRGNFLIWARAKYESKELSTDAEST